MAGWVRVTPQRHGHIPAVMPSRDGWWDYESMPDSDALRARRYRAHRAGDHHLCRHLAAVPLSLDASNATSADDLDPRAEMRQLAARLIDAHQADRGNAALAREARATLLALAGMAPDDEDDEFAALLSQPVPGYG
jgi:hypothetical protein